MSKPNPTPEEQEAERIALQANIADAKASIRDPNLSLMADMKNVTARDRFDVDRESDARINSEAAYYSARNKRLGGTALGSPDPSIVGDAAKSLVETVAAPLRSVGNVMLPYLPGGQPLTAGYYGASPVPGGPDARQPIVQQENVSPTVPVPDAGTDQTPEGRQQAQLAMLRAQIMGMRAPSVGMNKYQIRGFEGQQGALGEQMSAMDAGRPDIEAAQAGMQQVGQQYIGGLEKLNAQRQGVNDARRGAMAEDERKLAAAENTFDASRALRGMADSPVSTGAMSFAAGLVGALKGAAGDMSANQVLAEVDKAVERDVMNQKEQYNRMLQGQTTARTNFNDARRMGADDNEALAASTMASMDQHKRALQFAEQRVSGAREKASLKGAIYALDGQRGKLQMDLDLKNAAAQGSVNAAKMQALMLLKAGNAGMSLDDQIKQGNAYNAATKDERWQTSSKSLQSIAEMRKLQAEIPLEKQAGLWNTGVSKVIREALDRVAVSPDSGTAIAAISKYIGAQFKSDMTNDERKMLSFAQGMINNRLKDISGGSVTTGEQIRDLLSRNLDTFDGFNSWIDKSESDAMAGINSALAVGKFNPDVARVMEATVAPWIETNKQYAKSLNDMSRVGQQYGRKAQASTVDNASEGGGFIQ